MDTKPKEIKLAEKSRASTIETTNIQNLLQEARSELRADEQGVMDAMYMRVESAATDSAKIQGYKDLSSSWYQRAYYGIAGYYAEEVAKLVNDELAWSIAGTTYAKGVTAGRSEKVKDFSASRARQAFENAISINPENLNHKINLAVTYAERPISSDPMKGVLMLLDLNKQFPENVALLYQLARFGRQTGQYDKAIERLKSALNIEPGNKRVICLLADIYSEIGDQVNATEYQNLCDN